MRIPLLILSLAIGLTGQVAAQPTIGLVAYYSFDNCDATDDTGNGADGVMNGNPGCGCGVMGNALEFDGGDDFIQFLGSFDILFSEDFTLSFYMQSLSTGGIVDIISKKESCTPDSSITVRFEPAVRAVRAELSQDINAMAESRADISPDQCWHHIAWVRSGTNLVMFYDGEAVEIVQMGQSIDATNNGIFSIANSPCLANGELRFAGAMDELRLYNRALSTGEIAELFTPIDRIASRDTALFLGNAIQISLPNSCATSFAWTPAQGVVAFNDREPMITPTITTTYEVTMEYGFCTASDTIQLIVVDSTQLNCESVFLPNAFTPNGDGLNDVFGMSNAFFLGDFGSLQIYDRWGSLLFEGFTPDAKWDGSYESERLLPGTYIYKLRYRCDGIDRIKTGSVNLLR